MAEATTVFPPAVPPSLLGRVRAVQHIWLLSAGFVVLVVMCGITVWLLDESKRDSDMVLHTVGVGGQLSEMQLLIHRATSSQYGYVVTGSRGYLDLYRKSVDDVPAALRALRKLVSDNPAQVERADQLNALIEERLTELRKPVELALAGRPKDALDLQRSVDNPSISLAIVGVIDRMRFEENQLLAERTQNARDTRLWLLGVSLVGGLMIVLLATVSVAEVRRAAAVQREAQKQLEFINTSLEERVQERTAALQTANQEIQRFAYIVSHDLRSPLVNIMGFTSELETLRGDLFDRMKASGAHPAAVDDIEKGPGKDFDESLGFIKAAIGKMDRLINAILRLSRVGHQEFKVERVDLEAVIRAIRSTLAHQLQTTAATISIQPLPTIVTDRLAVEQVFSNLLDNALKYLRPGVKGEIQVSADEKGNFVVVRVADNGRGIDVKDSERIFELFRRSGQQDKPGEGIGLAHVRMLVRRLGGRIGVDSEIGKGSVFTVILPKTLAEG
jgi:signal transduction histidine kinase